jgi:hypothetical protein
MDHRVFDPTELCHVPVLSTTRVMRKKANGRYKARITAREFEQRDGEHFDSNKKKSSVVNDTTIRIIFTLIVVASFWK